MGIRKIRHFYVISAIDFSGMQSKITLLHRLLFLKGRMDSNTILINYLYWDINQEPDQLIELWKDYSDIGFSRSIEVSENHWPSRLEASSRIAQPKRLWDWHVYKECYSALFPIAWKKKGGVCPKMKKKLPRGFWEAFKKFGGVGKKTKTP